MPLIFKAMQFAEKAHRGQFRKYNTDIPYFIHPMRVMYRLRDKGKTHDNILCAALLHDTVEDCGVKFEELERAFNKDIAFLVLELTQPDKLSEEVHKLPRIERHNLLLEKLKGISNEAKWIKYYDRIDNLNDVRLDKSEEHTSELQSHVNLVC